MALIAQTNLQFILEVAIFIQVAVMLLLNIVPVSLSLVLFFALILGVGLTMLFGADALFLFLPGMTHHEFTHPYGPLALLAVITLLAALPMMQEVGIKVRNLKGFTILLIVIITVVGGLMHRSFLLLWFLGLVIGLFVISKSLRQKSIFTVKRIILGIAVVLAGFGSLELLSRLLSMQVLSPLLRIERIQTNAISSVEMVIKNTTLFGHVPTSSYWGAEDMGSSSGYISLPISMIMLFGLPFPVFFGILVTKKDVIDYMLPGIFGFAYDFGYIVMILLLAWCVFVMVSGFKILEVYREKRERGNRNYLGREALLIGSLTAFISQALVGLFLMNRSINGTALLTFMFLSALVVAHVLVVKKD
ncbi:hypothetical protein [Methanobacterium aggregans]|uniref:hypothetical protein n=1 Tax=Methanobacterium aggregans TaxID=1615586 RepID=UPI00320E42BB